MEREKKSIEIFDFLDYIFINDILDCIGSLSQNLIVLVHVW